MFFRVFLNFIFFIIIYLQKNSKVCTQLRIFQKEIKSTLNQELMHWMHLKVFLKLKKTLKTLSSWQIYKKKKKKKNAGFFFYPGFLQPCVQGAAIFTGQTMREGNRIGQKLEWVSSIIIWPSSTYIVLLVTLAR